MAQAATEADAENAQKRHSPTGFMILYETAHSDDHTGYAVLRGPHHSETRFGVDTAPRFSEIVVATKHFYANQN